jgi:chromosomal replication initiator protein
MTNEEIITTICKRMEISKETVMSKSRKHDCVLTRHLCIYFIWETSFWTLKRVGKLFGRHHSTIIHALNSVNDRIDVDKRFRHMFNHLHDEIIGYSYVEIPKIKKLEEQAA